MGCGTATLGSACGGGRVLDGPAARDVPDQETFPGDVADWLAEDGAVSSPSEGAAEARPIPSQAEASFVEVWFLLPEGQKQELGAMFSQMVMKRFQVLSGTEDK
ncbi:MAG: hypothetical protein ACE5I7_17285 [Candidatus Binatia bacterium]